MSIDNLSSMIVLQSDWEELIKSNTETIWVLYKKLGHKGNHGKLGDEKFTIKNKTDRTITICYEPTSSCTKFIAPCTQFKNIHSKCIVSLDVAPGGLGVSVASSDADVKVWETKSGLVRRTLKGHIFDAYMCRLFPSGVVVLSGGGDMQLRIWDAATGICPIVLKGHTGAITDAAFVHRGKNIISVSKDGTAKLWNCAQALCLATIKIGAEINCCAITSLENYSNNECHEDALSDYEFDTGGKVLCVGCSDGRLVVINVATRKTVGCYTFSSVVQCVMYKGVTCIIGLSDGAVWGWSLQLELSGDSQSSPFKICHDSSSPIESMCFVANSMVAVGRRDGTCQVYTMAHVYVGHGEERMETDDTFNTTMMQLTGPDCDAVFAVASDAQFVFTACRDATVRRYLIRDIVT